MLSVNRVLELLNDEMVSAEEAEVLRDACREMAEILYEKYKHEKHVNNTNHGDNNE